jgi:hypothetical protein
MADMQASVIISAETDSLRSGMAAATAVVQQASAAMRAQLAGIGATARQAQAQFAATYSQIGTTNSRLVYSGTVAQGGSYQSFAAGERLKLEAARGNWDQIAAIYEEWAAKAAAIYGEDSAQYKRVLAEKAAAERQATQQMFAAAERDFSARRGIDEAYLGAFKSDMAKLVAEHKVTLDQALGFEIQYSAQLHGEERQRLEDMMADDRLTVADKTRVYQQLLELDARYTQQVEADTARITRAQQQAAQRQAQLFVRAFNEVGRSFDSTIAGLIEGTTSWQRAMQNLFGALLRAFIDMVMQMVSVWLASGLASMLGITGLAPGAGIGTVLGTALSKALPIFDKGGIVPSAAGGWVVPALGSGGTLAMLHSQEMVLPAGISQGLQSMIAGGGGGTVNFSVAAIDARSVAQFFASNKDLLVRTLAQASRGFNPALAGSRP